VELVSEPPVSTLQRSSRADATGSPNGRPLEPAVRHDLERRLGQRFDDVRIHEDDAATALGARAFATGTDVVFAPGQFDPGMPAGRALLGHELWHVAQQRSPAGAAPGPAHERNANAAAAALVTGASPPQAIAAGPGVQRQPKGMGDVKLADQKAAVLARRTIRYDAAEKSNTAYDKRFHFATALKTAAGGNYASLAQLWADGKHDAFADAVAGVQFDLNVPEEKIDGILGPGTWFRLVGLGEAMASIESVQGKQAQELCYAASRERIERGVQLSSGQPLRLTKAQATKLDWIIAVHEWRMGDIEERYRGTGAAGALVFLGLGTFVPEADIWTGGLRPGAAMQVWRHRDAFELLRVGSVALKGGKTRPIQATDANFYGTSFVFVRYVGSAHDEIEVRHFSGVERHKKSDFEVWVAANTNAP
jgi:hypothetical protein